MPRTLLFLDIDGVLLVRDSSRYGYRVADHAAEFLAFAVTHFDTRWLSSRCSFQGDPEEARRAFRLAGLAMGDPAWAAIEQIGAVGWSTYKASAIDMQSDFWWADDQPDALSLAQLAHNGRSDRLIRVSGEETDALLRVRAILEAASR